MSYYSTNIEANLTVNRPPNLRNHAACLASECLFVLGGRYDNNNICHDLWKFDFKTMTWTQVRCGGEQPRNLEGHTLVSYKNQLLLFGGQFFNGSGAVSILNLDPGGKEPRWKLCMDRGPRSLRYHSAVIHDNSMYVFGGYVDMIGSICELWQFDCVRLSWHLAYDPKVKAVTSLERHAHSAVVSEGRMWVYGGTNKLKTLGDLLAWNLESRTWSRVKTQVCPSSRHNHSCVNLGDSMAVIGGVHKRRILSDVWIFTYASQVWCQVSEVGNSSSLSCRSHHISVCHTATTSSSNHGNGFHQSLRGWAGLKADRTRQSTNGDGDRSATPTYQRFKNTVLPAEKQDLIIEATDKISHATTKSPMVAWQQKEIVSLDDVLHCVKSAVKPLQCDCTGDGLYVDMDDAPKDPSVTAKQTSVTCDDVMTSTAVDELRNIITLGGVVGGRSSAEPRPLSVARLTLVNSRLAFVAES